MASFDEECEVDQFIRPIRCLYNDYSTTVSKFKEDHSDLLENYDLEDLGDDVRFKLYSEFSKDNDGELAHELVQTWICDNRLEVTNCVRIALENRNQSFCNWFRNSEKYSSPDELLLYCLGKQNNLHVTIFNRKYVWSTLSKHIRYDYPEIVEHSDILLVFLGERHYAIFRKKRDPAEDQLRISSASVRGRNKSRTSANVTKKDTKKTKKTVCRSSNRKPKSASATDKRSKTLESSRKERYGIGSAAPTLDAERYGRGKRRSNLIIDYRKLNEGDEGDEEAEPRLVSPKRSKHIPTRSGPTPQRQISQRQSTESPKVRTLSTVKTRKQTTVSNQSLIGVPSGDSAKVSPSTAGDKPILFGTPTSTTSTNTAVVTDAFLGIPETDNPLLPDLVVNVEHTPDHEKDLMEGAKDIPSTEDEQSAVDALLSLSIPPIAIEPDIEDNSLLVPIGGQAICEDVAPTESRLGQIEVDREIARMLTTEEHKKLENNEKTSDEERSSSLTGVQSQTPNVRPTDMVQSALHGVQPHAPESQQPVSLADNEDIDKTNTTTTVGATGARSKTPSVQSMSSTAGKKGSKGAFKSQLYGLRRKHPKDRAYKCQVCGTSKRSMESLNDHHRRNHNPQMCGVCSKMFDLATTLAHHMYSHYTRKYHCDKCEFHCFFKSELEAHKIVHRDRPSHQCMYPKCGRWFKRKGELSLHVEIHKKTWYDCKKCDFSTKLLKYLKEHEKSHLNKKKRPPICL